MGNRLRFHAIVHALPGSLHFSGEVTPYNVQSLCEQVPAREDIHLTLIGPAHKRAPAYFSAALRKLKKSGISVVMQHQDACPAAV